MNDLFDLLQKAEGFDWDKGNIDKNWIKHRVLPTECEQVFFNQPLLVKDDESHSLKEVRFYVLGRTDEFRLLFLVFTMRKNKIRIISARDMSKDERKVYKSL